MDISQNFKVLRNFTASVAFHSKLATYNHFWKNQDFFSENPSFYPNLLKFFELFEKSYYFSRILQQICYLYISWWNHDFFSKAHFFWKKPEYLTFWTISSFYSHFVLICLRWAIFETLIFFVEKFHLFFEITQTMNV